MRSWRQQRLGSIALRHDEAQEIELFDWTGLAAEAASAEREHVVSLTSRCRAGDELARRLTQQMEDLIRAKEEHENMLLQKFRQLLNAKKLKIREQQRLLNGAEIDPAKGACSRDGLYDSNLARSGRGQIVQEECSIAAGRAFEKRKAESRRERR